jgi:hypothetical protein
MTTLHMSHIYFKYARRAYASRVSGRFSGLFSGRSGQFSGIEKWITGDIIYEKPSMQ